jgi:hypothetical protein
LNKPEGGEVLLGGVTRATYTHIRAFSCRGSSGKWLRL